MPPGQKAKTIMIQWKDIPGYEHIYQASTDGRIRTCEGKTTTSIRHGVRLWKQRELKQHYCQRKNGKNGDARVTLWKDKKPHYCLVSRLIALTWCDGYRQGLTVNHIDGNPKNNNASNLEWITLEDNIKKGFKNGLYQRKRCTLINGDGIALTFNSCASASRYLNRNVSYVSNAIKQGKRYVSSKD